MATKTLVSSIVLFLVLAGCYGQDGDGDGGETPSSPLDYLTNPKLAAALEAAEKLKNLVHTSSSNHITTREKTSGFEFLGINARAQSSKGIPPQYMKRIVSRALNPFTKGASTDIKEIVQTFKDFIEFGIEEHQEQFFAIMSNKGNGKISAIFVYFKLREDGKYNFKKMLFSGRFKLAADLVITRSSKKGFFSSSSKDVINYLPRRGITAQDINALLNLIVPKIALILNDFIPPQSSK